MSKAILDALDYVDTLTGLDGKQFRQVKSIAFHNMDAIEFNDLIEEAIDLVITRLIPGLGSSALMAEVTEMIGN